MEMIKGIKGHGYYDELVIPIIENTAYEYELTESLAKAVRSCNAFSLNFICWFFRSSIINRIKKEPSDMSNFHLTNDRLTQSCI